MKNEFKYLLSPFRIKNTIFKNRIFATTSEPHYLNGAESYPNDAVIDHYRIKAKAAAVVSVTGFGELGGTRDYPDFMPMTQFPDYDLYDRRNANQFVRLTENIHQYQSLANGVLGYQQGGMEFSFQGKNYKLPQTQNFDELTKEEMQSIIAFMMRQALALKEVGFDMVSVHAAYGRTLLGQSVSELTNHRADEYGGCIENRVRFVKEICQAIRNVCGDDFLIDLLITGHEESGGNTVEDTISILRMLDGVVDIAQIRGTNAVLAHPTGFEEEVPYLDDASLIRAAGVPQAITAVGGFFYPKTCDKAVKDGAADFIGMARSFISNPDYGELLYEGRGEDIVPCIRCNKCHTSSLTRPFISDCSVNPWIALSADRDKFEGKSSSSKKIAVIGGGPAGMKAAITAADRGHKVTLFEASDSLGGQLKHSEYASFKWPLRDFKNYLIEQVKKRPAIIVELNHAVTPEEIKSLDFDVVLVGVGSKPLIPPIKGINDKVYSAIDVFGREKELAEDVVVIGGGEIGVETGLYLEETGHKVTVLEMRDQLAADANPVHYRENMELALERAVHLRGIVDARALEVTENGVLFADMKTGETKLAEGRSIVLSCGMIPLREEAMQFSDAAPFFAVIGDVADKTNCLIECMKSAVRAVERF